MAKKIQGFTVRDGGEIPNITPFPPNDYPQCVTVVLHEQRHERVFTESEVRAILNTFMNHLRDGCSVMSGDVRAVARYHGIVLDPA